MRQFPKIDVEGSSPSARFETPSGAGRPRGVARWQWQVDAALFHAACQHRWCCLSRAGHFGRHLPDSGYGKELLHNWIMARFYGRAPAWPLTTDHVDGNPANNTLANLRPATLLLQNLNRKTSLGFVRVGSRFRARLCKRWLGTFATEAEARAAYLGAKEKAMATEIRNSWLIYRNQLEEARNG